jgi:hypothetical protein
MEIKKAEEIRSKETDLEKTVDELSKEKDLLSDQLHEERIKSIEGRLLVAIESQISDRAQKKIDDVCKLYYNVLIGTGVFMLTIFTAVGTYFGYTTKISIENTIEEKVTEQLKIIDYNKIIDPKVDQEITKQNIQNLVKDQIAKQSISDLVKLQIGSIVSEKTMALDNKIKEVEKDIEKQAEIAKNSLDQKFGPDSYAKLNEILTEEPGKDTEDILQILKKSVEASKDGTKELSQALSETINDYETKLNENSFFAYLGTFKENQWIDPSFKLSNKDLPNPEELSHNFSQQLIAITFVNARKPPNDINGRIKLGDKIGVIKPNESVKILSAIRKVPTSNNGYYYLAQVKKITR